MAEALYLADDKATADLGRRIALSLRPGDVVLLSGDLGAGKTSLARAIVRTLMNDPDLDVPSPSFALVQPYAGATGPVLHADLYRLTSERDAEELGLFERDDAIVLVEWPENAPSLHKLGTVHISLAVPKEGEGRHASIELAGEPLR